MRTLHRLALFGVLFVALSASLLASEGVQTAQAQEETWCVLFDFTVGDADFNSGVEGWTLGTPAEQVDDVGWVDGIYNRGISGESQRSLQIQRAMPEMEITDVTVIASGVAGTNVPDFLNEWRIGIENDPDIDYIEEEDLSAAEALPTSFSWSGDRALSEDTNMIFGTAESSLSYRNDSTTPDGSGVISQIEMEGVGETNPFQTEIDTRPEDGFFGCEEPEPLIRPLTAGDEHPDFGLIDWTSQEDLGDFLETFLGLSDTLNTVEAFSQTPYANVYAAAGGIATYAHLNNCGDFCVTLAPPTPEDEIFDTYKLQDDSDLFVVRVQISEIEELQYIVKDADLYLNQGMSIEAGCILGKTVPLEAIGNFTIPDAEVALVALVTTDDQTAHELLSQLIEYPTEAEACNADPRFADCLASNPRFLNNGEGWYTTGSVTFDVIPDPETGTMGGAALAPGAEIYGNFILPTEDDLTLNTSVLASSSGVVQLWIGSFIVGLPVTASTSYQLLELPPQAPTGSIGGGGTLFEVGIKNLTDSVLKITHLCVTGDDPGATRGNCYFHNPSFELFDSYWDSTGSPEFNPGYVLMFDGDTLSQDVSLEPGDYRITARMEVLNNSYTSVTGDVQLQYEFPSGDGYSEVGTVHGTDPFGELLDFSVDFTVDDATDDTMNFTVEIQDGADEDIQGILIDSLCLEALTTPFPPGGGGVVDPPFHADCQAVFRPASDAPVQLWLSWLWANLNRFFECELMVLLDQWYVVSVNAINTMTRVARYFIIVAQRQAAWAESDFIPYLGGYLDNIALGRSTTIIQDVGSGECHDIFCLLQSVIEHVLSPLVDLLTRIADTLLQILLRVAGLLLDTITGLIGLFFVVFGSLIQFVFRMLGYLSSLVHGFNNVTPIPLPGIPQCQLDPQGNAVCIGLWMLENTVFADEGALYIPLLIGAMSIGLLFWLVTTIRREISELGDKL